MYHNIYVSKILQNLSFHFAILIKLHFNAWVTNYILYIDLWLLMTL